MEGGTTLRSESDIMNEEVDEMTTAETERLIRWLVEHGHSYEEAYECIAFMAGKTIE